jgi:hypothetical protein
LNEVPGKEKARQMPGFLFLPPLRLSVVSSAVLWKVVGSRLDFFSNSSGSFFRR